MRLSLIAAVAADGVIGSGGRLPWHLPADLKRFRHLTRGHHLLVGRRTWEAIGRPLPERRIVVISRRAPPHLPGVLVARSLAEAVAVARDAGDGEAFVGGGGQIFRLALPSADRVYLTRVGARIPGDVRFPDLEAEEWTLASRRRRDPDAANPYPLDFELWERKR